MISREEKEKTRETNIRKAQCLNIATQIITSEIKAGQRELKGDGELITEMIVLAERIHQTLEERKYWVN